MDYRFEAKKIGNHIIDLWHEIHTHPELDLELPLTKALVIRELEDIGLSWREYESCSAVSAVIKGTKEAGNKPVRTVALRADMDALPIQELSELPFASVNPGVMHACGHDTHVAMVLGAARILQEHRDEFSGNIKLLFQPGEEKSGGAKPMIAEGALEDPHVDVCFNQHINCLHPELQNGQVGTKKGAMMASRDSFVIKVKGVGCHGARPEEGVDPVVIAAHLIIALQALVTREVPALVPVVLTVGAVEAGKAYNIIPEEAVLKGSVRCADRKTRDMMEKRITELSMGLTASMRAECVIDYERGYDPVINRDDAVETVLATASELFGEERTVEVKNPVMGSEDFSFFIEEAGNGCFWYMNANPRNRDVFPNHNPRFTVDESLLPDGSAMLAAVAVNWLRRHS